MTRLQINYPESAYMIQFFRTALILLVVSLPAHGTDAIEADTLQQPIQQSEFDVSIDLAVAGSLGVSDVVGAYMILINTNDVELQRVIARKIFRDKHREPELMELIAKKLDGLYLQPGLSKLEQDTAAWFCKALGQTGDVKYARQLAIVANSSPYKKIYQHAARYAMPGIDTVVTLETQSAGDAAVQELAPKFNIEGLYASEVTSNSHYYFDKKSYRSLRYQFQQDGNNVVGFNDQINLKVVGKLEGDTISFYTLPSKMGPSELTGKWKVSSDGKVLRGSWHIGGGGGKWNLTKIE